LRAIAAILRAAAGLDAEQGRELDLVGRVVRAVDTLRLVEEVEQGQIEEAAISERVQSPLTSSC
jgi:hypothetical protein